MHLSRTDEVTIDVELLDRGFDAIEILLAEFYQRGEFFFPAALAIGKTMRQRGGTKTAVASAGADGNLPRFKQDDIPAWVSLLGLQRRPQTGVASANDGKVGLDLGCKRWGWFWFGWIIQPKGFQLHIRYRPQTLGARSG